MEELINTNYLIALISVWIVSGWLHMLKRDAESNYDFIMIMQTPLYGFLLSMPFIVIIISLIINWVNVGFLSTCCYAGILFLTQLLNVNLLYYIYRSLFGRTGIGLLIPLIAILPLFIYLFVVQF
jgi:hypothetical protein